MCKAKENRQVGAGLVDEALYFPANPTRAWVGFLVAQRVVAIEMLVTKISRDRLLVALWKLLMDCILE